MKLYRVTLTTDVMVFAESEGRAITIAEMQATDQAEIDACEYDGHLPPGWNTDTLVYQGGYMPDDLSVKGAIKKATPTKEGE